MSERSRQISKLLTDKNTRTAYIKAKLGVLVPSQVRALRFKSDMPRQADLAMEAEMQQSRISMLETPGAANVTLETLARLAAIFNVGLIVKFVPFSEMLHWENTFSQDRFDVIRLNHDQAFLNPTAAISHEVAAIEDARRFALEPRQIPKTGLEMQPEGILRVLGPPLDRRGVLTDPLKAASAMSLTLSRRPILSQLSQ